jgi:hypothetical protein
MVIRDSQQAQISQNFTRESITLDHFNTTTDEENCSFHARIVRARRLDVNHFCVSDQQTFLWLTKKIYVNYASNKMIIKVPIPGDKF